MTRSKAFTPDSTWLQRQPIAHRGLHSKTLPENSLGAFQAAVESGYGIELDVHLSRDGILMVHHDTDTGRLTGSQLLIAESAADDLTKLRLADSKFTIPRLSEVLQLVRGRVPLLIELKTGNRPDQVGPAVIELLDNYDGAYAVISFDPRILAWFRRHAPHVLRGQTASAFRDESLPAYIKFSLRWLLFNWHSQPHFINYNIDDLPFYGVSRWQRRNPDRLLAWTVKTPAEADRARQLGANIIFESITPSRHDADRV